MKKATIFVLYACMSVFVCAEVTFEWVTIGDAGNADDGSYGGVDYEYRISSKEVTNTQYCEFLNAVAVTENNSGPERLYNSSMDGINRTGSNGSYSYSVEAGQEETPVHYICWRDALRFMNWLHNGQPTGDQDDTTTEDGAYNMSDGTRAYRAPDAKYMLPTEDEWYKAAYYDGSQTLYYDYATSSDTKPEDEAPPGGSNSANYNYAPGVLTDVGAYTNTLSPYGTFDQNGNVSEWTESKYSSSNSYRAVRGGSYQDSSSRLKSNYREQIEHDDEYSDLGFRVMTMPDGYQADKQVWSEVDDPDNADEGGYGAVSYRYRIARREVTNEEYCEFLNAVAATDDNTGPEKLYNTSMDGISRNGSSGSYSYSVNSGKGDHPVHYVCWLDALRYINWLHNGKPSGDQDDTTTEDGAYNMSDGNGAYRAPDAKYWLPSEDEWYKSAYYKGGDSDEYWDYATSSDTAPEEECPRGGANSANYDYSVNDLTDVGAYIYTQSPYGTFDQNGNVSEWTESKHSGSNNYRAVRGGSYQDSSSRLKSNYREQVEYDDEYSDLGFRVATTPTNYEFDQQVWADVDDTDNADEGGYGAVSYRYRIARREVTNEEYCEFLNAIAATDDNTGPEKLYNTSMDGISRSGSSGSYSYSVDSGKGDHPVHYVCWLDALRYVNWLHNGKPSGDQDSSTTEDGAYNMSGGTGAYRSGSEKYWLPDENEWYKAAYYKGGDSDEYWDYATSSDTAPEEEYPRGGDNSANYDYAVNNLTDVGAYVDTQSPYGMLDQNGNVSEWTESKHSSSNNYRAVRGGSYQDSSSRLKSNYREQVEHDDEYSDLGFRVATRPVDYEEDTTVWVEIGDPDNADDGGYGTVSYYYEISRREVTNEEYCEFLNAVAATDDNSGSEKLYNTSMDGISRSGSSGSYSYSVDSGKGDNPVHYVCWRDALRYVNWLHNGKPSGGQNSGTTEDGVYDMNQGAGNPTRQSEYDYFLPNEDEWYKAAYYKGGDSDEYWDYATGSDTAPVDEYPRGGDNSANYDYAVNNLTDVGAYVDTQSPYGTFDQNGNVSEWTESKHSSSNNYRAVRGGSYQDSSSRLKSNYREQVEYDDEYKDLGFRVGRLTPEEFVVTEGDDKEGTEVRGEFDITQDQYDQADRLNCTVYNTDARIEGWYFVISKFTEATSVRDEQDSKEINVETWGATIDRGQTVTIDATEWLNRDNELGVDEIVWHDASEPAPPQAPSESAASLPPGKALPDHLWKIGFPVAVSSESDYFTHTFTIRNTDESAQLQLKDLQLAASWKRFANLRDVPFETPILDIPVLDPNDLWSADVTTLGPMAGAYIYLRYNICDNAGLKYICRARGSHLIISPDPNDFDYDGIKDWLDLCSEVFDPNEFDGDADGLPDACDPCPGFPFESPPDADDDGIPDDCDLCVDRVNPDQHDSDEDTIGDRCECDAANLEDLNLTVDMADLAVLALDWMKSGPGLTGDTNRDDWVSIADLDQIVEHWLEVCGDP